MKAALVTVLLLLMPATAAAAPGDLGGIYASAQVWGMPACGKPTIEVATPQQYEHEHGTGVFTGEPEAWADEDRCVIVINPRLKIHTAVKRCHVIVHEWGHLTGFRDPSNEKDPQHSDNSRSVMYGEDLVSENRVYYTKKRWRWEAAGAFKPCYAMTAPGVQVG